jgi:hypothetical protein
MRESLLWHSLGALAIFDQAPFETKNPCTDNPMNIHISFNPDGTALCLWTEAVPLHELGLLKITRASNIEFNNTTQHWEVIDRKGRVRFIARSRAACLEWEHENLQPD